MTNRKFKLNSTDRILNGIIITNDQDNFQSKKRLETAHQVGVDEYGWSKRNISTIMDGKLFQSRLYTVLKSDNIDLGFSEELENFLNLNLGLRKNEEETGNVNLRISLLDEKTIRDYEKSLMLAKIDEVGIVKYLSDIKLWKKTGSRKLSTEDVLIHPLVFLMLCMEMHEEFYATVIVWLKDGLISTRHRTMDNKNIMTDAIRDFIPDWTKFDYPNLFHDINIKVIGDSYTGIRNFLPEEMLYQINQIQNEIYYSIKFKHSKTKEDVFNTLYDIKLI